MTSHGLSESEREVRRPAGGRQRDRDDRDRRAADGRTAAARALRRGGIGPHRASRPAMRRPRRRGSERRAPRRRRCGGSRPARRRRRGPGRRSAASAARTRSTAQLGRLAAGEAARAGARCRSARRPRRGPRSRRRCRGRADRRARSSIATGSQIGLVDDPEQRSRVADRHRPARRAAASGADGRRGRRAPRAARRVGVGEDEHRDRAERDVVAPAQVAVEQLQPARPGRRRAPRRCGSCAGPRRSAPPRPRPCPETSPSTTAQPPSTAEDLVEVAADLVDLAGRLVHRRHLPARHRAAGSAAAARAGARRRPGRARRRSARSRSRARRAARPRRRSRGPRRRRSARALVVDERERPDGCAADDHRDDDHRADLELAQRLEVLVVRGDLAQPLVGRAGISCGSPVRITSPIRRVGSARSG